jgi:hypothetical protein
MHPIFLLMACGIVIQIIEDITYRIVIAISFLSFGVLVSAFIESVVAFLRFAYAMYLDHDIHVDNEQLKFMVSETCFIAMSLASCLFVWSFMDHKIDLLLSTRKLR